MGLREGPVHSICIVMAGLRPAVFAATIALGALSSGSALAQSEIIDSDFGDECNVVNCNITSIAGWAGSSSSQVLPWTAKFLAEAGLCLRLQMSSINGPANLELVVVAPNGTTRYRNDQGGIAGCANCALVKIDPAPVSGFYTAIISSANGAPVDTDFHLLFGQFPSGNVNCASPTAAIP
jgi:hypothetical protein